MGAQENKQSAQAAYEAFANGDAAGAMENIDDSATWTVRGDNGLTGTYTGKQEIGELWTQIVSKGFTARRTTSSLTATRSSSSSPNPSTARPARVPMS